MVVPSQIRTSLDGTFRHTGVNSAATRRPRERWRTPRPRSRQSSGIGPRTEISSEYSIRTTLEHYILLESWHHVERGGTIDSKPGDTANVLDHCMPRRCLHVGNRARRQVDCLAPVYHNVPWIFLRSFVQQHPRRALLPSPPPHPSTTASVSKKTNR